MHTPVFLREVIESFEPIEGEKFIDATFGEGGHTRAILEKGGRVLGLDIDPAQIRAGKENFKDWIEKERLILVSGNFKNMDKIAKTHGFQRVKGVLFDLGISVSQLYSGKGLSYKELFDDLDMRFNKRFKNTAADLLNYLPAEELYEVLASYSEDPYVDVIVEKIVAKRHKRKFKKVKDLVELIERIVPDAKKRDKTLRRIFQALRIAVNNEMFNLEDGLSAALRVLKKGGRITVITFHSIEDRIVKRFVKTQGLKLIKKKGMDFGRKNIFERGARFRVIEV